jgi:transcriptional regulator with XRE-family HTH domain
MRFRKLRKLAGLTLHDVEGRTGINISRLSNAENGKVKLTAPEAYMLRTVLMIAVADKQKMEATCPPA